MCDGCAHQRVTAALTPVTDRNDEARDRPYGLVVVGLSASRHRQLRVEDLRRMCAWLDRDPADRVVAGVGDEARPGPVGVGLGPQQGFEVLAVQRLPVGVADLEVLAPAPGWITARAEDPRYVTPRRTRDL